jgi:formylglycine-generating enzyme required for sulfatase activity
MTAVGTSYAVARDPHAREVPPLDAVVELRAGRYPVGEPGEERSAALDRVLVGRWPVVNAHVKDFIDATGRRPSGALAAKLRAPQLADHPATDLTRADAQAFCAWASARLGRHVRLPTSAEWEALARGTDGRRWPWGDVFEEARCACAESAWGWTVPVTAHPAGASPFGAEQLAGNVWEWVADTTADGWAVVRGGSYLDTAWGLRASRVQPADPTRATATTGFRIAIDVSSDDRSAA